MSDSKHTIRGQSADRLQGDAVERMIRAAGERPALSDESRARIHTAAYEEWVRQTRPSRRLRLLIGSGIAAAVLLMLGATVTLLRPAPPGAPAVSVAHVERIFGTPQGDVAGDGTWAALGELSELVAGQQLRTGAADRMSVRTLPGLSLRMDTDTALRLLSATQVELLRGRIYIDSESAATTSNGAPGNAIANANAMAASIEVITALGTATDIGTQFVVEYDRESLRVQVREGAVNVRSQPANADAAAGEQLLIRDNGSLQRSAMAPGDARWSWVESVSPRFHSNGRRLAEFLNWVSRETGMSVAFTNADTEHKALDIRIMGSIGDLPPSQALAMIMATNRLEYSIEGDTITVGDEH